MTGRFAWALCALSAISVCGPFMAQAQVETGDEMSAQEVAEMMSDPAAELTFFNASYRAYLDIGPFEDTIHEVRLQGAGFLTLPSKSLIAYRAYVPLYSMDWPVDDDGVGDALFSAYWASRHGNLVMGYGGALIAPTASEDYFGLDKWCAGPTLIIAQKVPGICTLGGLLTHIWSFAGNDEREDVSLTTIQPACIFFLNELGTSLTLTSETTYDWQVDDDAWRVPATLVLEQVLPPVGSVYFSVAAGGTYYIEKPEYEGDWDARATLSLIIP